MDADEARALLGVGPGASDAQVRTAYRRLVRVAHPDVAGADPQAGLRIARLTRAYAVLRPRPSAVPPPRPPPAPSRPPARTRAASPAPAATVRGCSLLLGVPADEAFFLVLDAAHRVGEVTYVDSHIGLLEAVLQFEGGPACSLLLTFQGRAGGTEAFCTLEPLEARPCPPVEPVVRQLAAALPPF